MKLEVGMYVRTPKGIDKIKTIYQKGNPEFVCYFLTKSNSILRWNYDTQVYYFSIDGECFDKEEIKASYNIIDLIEVGDYVNGLKVVQVKLHLHNDIEIVLSNGKFEWSFSKNESDYDIKSIVTKEMFESMSYKVDDAK